MLVFGVKCDIVIHIEIFSLVFLCFFHSNANACHIKVASMAAEQEDYAKAIQIYEKVSKASMESR